MNNPRLATLTQPAPARDADETSCPLCSKTFRMVDNCHDGCPMSNGCSLVRCPNCRFEFPDPNRSWLASRLKKWFGPKEPIPLGETR